jgi:hypothetical protein
MAKRRRTDNINTMACAKVERTNDFRLNRWIRFLHDKLSLRLKWMEHVHHFYFTLSK